MNFKLVLCMAGLILAAIAAGCDADRTTDISPTPTPMAEATYGRTSVRVADITGNMNNYLGKTVTVVADVEEVFGPRAFSLDEDAPLAGGVDNDLLVLGPRSINLTTIDDQWVNNKVRVTGMVRKMVASDIEREIGWDLDAKIENRWRDNKAVLIANSVERVQ